MTHKVSNATMWWTFAITSLALFMVTLDNLVVTTALPVIRQDLNSGLSGLEWTVNAYTLTFAVFLLTGAALGDRFGRRRMFAIGLGIFTLASAAAALAPSIATLDAARAVQGLGVAIVMPLTLTILSAAVPPERRGLALGLWGAIGGLAIAFGPIVGGAVVEGFSWQYIFWLNVPIGILVVPLALTRLTESHGPGGKLDLPGVGLVSAGMFGLVWGLVRGNDLGWTSPQILTAFGLGVVFTAAFVAWELRARNPMLPMRFFRNRAFSLGNVSSMFMFFGILGTGLTLQAIALGWIAFVSTPTTPYSELIAPFIIAGVGMALFFAPMANVVLSAVGRKEEGQASGANNAIRELGGVFGV